MWVTQILAHPTLSFIAKVVGVAISLHMNGKRWQAWPTHTRLAKMCAISRRSSERATKELEQAGLLLIRRKANCNNIYEMRLIATGETGPSGETGGTATNQSPHSDQPVALIATDPSLHSDYVVARTSEEPLSEPLNVTLVESSERAPEGTPKASSQSESSDQGRSVPSDNKLKFNMRDFQAEMAARGMDMGASRRERGNVVPQ